MDDVQPDVMQPYVNAESEPQPSLKRDGRGGRVHSVYDLGANDKISRNAKARVRADSDAESALLQVHLDGAEVQRPKTRGDCLPGGCNEARPCPFVGCKHHLYLEVNKDTGSLQVNQVGLEPWELEESCALDVTDREHGVTLEKAGALLNRTRERVRQIESDALAKLRKHLPVVE